MYRTEIQRYNAFLPPGSSIYQIPPTLQVKSMAATLEAQLILSDLLHKLQQSGSKYEARYGEWMKRAGSDLEDFLFRCLRREVLVYLQLGNGNVNSLKNIGGDVTFNGRAIYLHGLLGMDKKSRIYIGQSSTLNTRIKQHWNFRYRRDNPSLHYHAMQQSIFDNFTVLAILPSPGSKGYQSLPGMDQPELVLNVLEMWCCLLFRTLPKQFLETWLPEHLSKGSKLYRGASESAGLNIAIPVDHGDYSSRSWVDLSTSVDPLVLDFVKGSRSPVIEVKKEKDDAIEVKTEKSMEPENEDSMTVEEQDFHAAESESTGAAENEETNGEVLDPNEDVRDKIAVKRGLPRIEFQVSIDPIYAAGVVVIGLVAMRFIRGRRW